MNVHTIQKLINDKFLNVNGRLISQALTLKGFTERQIDINIFHFMEERDLFNVQNLYNFLNSDSKICPNCNKNNRRFVSFKDGYKDYCNDCGRKLNNAMSKQGEIDFTTYDNLKDTKNNWSSSKLKRLSANAVNYIKSQVPHLKSSSLSEYLYCIENDVISYPLCTCCGKSHHRFTPNIGYKDTCSSKCAWKLVDNTSRTVNIRTSFYEKYKIKYDEFLKDNPDYELEMFSLEDYLISNNNSSIKFLHKPCGTEFVYNVNYQGNLHCPKCFKVRSKQQFFIQQELKNMGLVVKSNDRQLIAPKEVDLLVSDYNFGIEYDSLMYHSFGKNTDTRFDNSSMESIEKDKHVNKTDEVESKHHQLFRIFSTEWLDIKTREIWLSVIRSKIGKTDRIYARKCEIRMVDNIQSSSFLNENHLQGNVNSKIKIGLYFDDELISLMTFGKARREKWKGENNYELLRFCNKKNVTIVGGASKLLSQFVKIVKPSLLISYANRRWSTGNLYEKLGFEFVGTSKPNYFYFLGGDDSKIQSREKYMKHKLEHKLDVFDPKITESNNMYNNNYRKIYDSGNKIYLKRYE